jgi:hypothetical protein
MQHFEKLMNRLEDGDDRAAVLHAVAVFYPLYTRIFAGLPIAELNTQERHHAA